MNFYYFYDGDLLNGQEYELKDEAYCELISLCFFYSEFVRFTFDDKSEKWLDDLAPFLIEAPVSVVDYRVPPRNIRFFRACSQLKTWMLEHTNDIFDWLGSWGGGNPEDPAFYRSDGSLLFESIIHEGELSLYLKDDEDAQALFLKSHWINKRRSYE